jgi:hypothetical protein
MKILFLPLTLILVVLSGIVLVISAFISTLISLLASLAAYVIIRLVVWQESELLVKLTSILGTQKIEEETK